MIFKLYKWFLKLFEQSPQDIFFERCFLAGLTPEEAALLWLKVQDAYNNTKDVK